MPIKFEDVANVEDKQEYNANPFKDEISDCESDSDISLCAGSVGMVQAWVGHFVTLKRRQDVSNS